MLAGDLLSPEAPNLGPDCQNVHLPQPAGPQAPPAGYAGCLGPPSWSLCGEPRRPQAFPVRLPHPPSTLIPDRYEITAHRAFRGQRGCMLAQDVAPLNPSGAPAGAIRRSLLSKTAPAILERGPHHRGYQWTEEVLTPNGGVRTERHRYTQVATGLHYFQDGQWLDSEEKIEITADGAAALHGAHTVVFAPNINTAGAIALGLPGGGRFVFNPVGLAYVDWASGQSVVVANNRKSPLLHH